MDIDERFSEWSRGLLEQHPDGDSPLECDVVEAAHLIMVLGWIERRLFSQHLAEYGLTIPQFFTLVAIHRYENGCSMGMLAEETQQCSATMTGIIDRLLKMGLVRRDRDDNDRRLVRVHLTRAGHELLHKTLNKRVGRLRQVLSQLDAENRKKVIEALKLFIMHSQEEVREGTSAAC